MTFYVRKNGEKQSRTIFRITKLIYVDGVRHLYGAVSHLTNIFFITLSTYIDWGC